MLTTSFVARVLSGRRKRPPRIERRWTRVDLSLHASLPYGSTTSIPERHALGGWAAAVVEKADAAFTHVDEKGGRVVAVLGGHGDLELQTHCGPNGLVSLSAVAISGFRMVCVPRVWDSPERRAVETDPRRELSRLVRTFKTALNDWTESILRARDLDPVLPAASRREPRRALVRRRREG